MTQQLRETFHDMRQPIASTMALAAAALTEPGLPAAARDRLQQIIKQAEWLADMIHSCLTAQQQEEPEETTEPSHDLADIVNVVGEVVAAECLTWAGDVTLTAPAGPVWCMFSRALLRRTVSNVLDNAVRAAGPDGTVSIEIQQRDDAVMLAVEDNGPGFGEIPSGVGLGLSAVARNVIKYGGRIEYSCGAARRRAGQPMAFLNRIRPKGAGPVRLVLCDDNRILCEALGVALEARGHQVLATATTSALGIDEVAKHRPDACLLDLRFADPPDGLGAARIMRERYPETAVLLLSGLVDSAVLVEATQIGVAGVLRKDQNVDHIAGVLGVIASGGVIYGPAQAHRTRFPDKRRYYPARDLTSREREVLRRIVAGQNTRQMAREMNVATSTLRTYVMNMLAKIGVHTRLEAAALATRENLLGDQTA